MALNKAFTCLWTLNNNKGYTGKTYNPVYVETMELCPAKIIKLVN